jgi:hypothetical protein
MAVAYTSPYEEIKYTTWKLPSEYSYWGGTGTAECDTANNAWYSNPNIVYTPHSQYYTNGGTTCSTWEPINVTATITGTSYTWPLYEHIKITQSAGLEYVYSYPIVSKQDIEKARLKSNLIIQIKSRASSIEKYPGESEPERRALDTLREIISEEEFRKYLRYGFVLVKGKSGATYQIFRNASHCKVWLNGQLIEEVCVRIKDEQVPKTDKIIAFKTIIETSEEQFKKLGNVYKMAKAA